MSDVFIHLLDLFSRYLHIACATVLVGGTLFYEMVVPEAVEELKQEQQLDVVGRARWVFKRLVWTAAIILVVSGIISTRKHWSSYERGDRAALLPAYSEGAAEDEVGIPAAARRPGWWWAAHASTGLLSVVIALFLTSTRRPPTHPIGWMRLNLVILLVVMFLASVTRHVRTMNQDAEQGIVQVPFALPRFP